ncbi:lysyl endopeptidase [Saccharothrix algeriensis]|uniref:lysyl endopeptidase n=1 Tax=Saccharothrix algeriensis TaxID=173560 RepID=UPI003555F1D0
MALKRYSLIRVLVALATVAAGAVGPTGAVAAADPGRSAIFGGGPFYSGGQQDVDVLRSSGFTTVIVWSVHVDEDGSLGLNDTRIVTNGAYVGDPGWPGRLRALKQQPTSVDRVEVSVGSAGVRDWENIRDLIAEQGTGPDSALFKNFRALKDATGADAINTDDESAYDVASTVAFARMAERIGFRNFTFAPYEEIPYWQGVKHELGPLVDRVYLQVYAGGADNDPAEWARALGMPVDPGLWSKHGDGCAAGDSPEAVEERMRGWKASAGIPGGFMWLYDDIRKCAESGGPTAREYARAINAATAG